jgi:hypothetical protein
MSEGCRVCGGAASPFGMAQVQGKHPVRYFRCGRCGFVQTEKPYWLAEAYEQALSGLDVGAVSRNLRLAPVVRALITRTFDCSGRFVDYGGGSGLFVRLMRDAGFDFRWLDKFATNVFARGFEADAGPFELLTAFEVFEHLEEPVAELERMLKYSRNVLLTTELLPPEVPGPGEWWYYGLEHGQHVAFYTLEALQALANRFGLQLCSRGELHLFSEKQIKERHFRLSTNARVVRWLDRRPPRPSLIAPDYQLIASQLKERHFAAAESKKD